MSTLTKISARRALLEVARMSYDSFTHWVKGEGIGMTLLSYKIGECMTESDLSVAEAARAKFREEYKKLDRLNNMTRAVGFATMGQFFDEAIRFYAALKEAKIGTSTSVAASQFGVDNMALSRAVHRRF